MFEKLESTYWQFSFYAAAPSYLWFLQKKAALSLRADEAKEGGDVCAQATLHSE